jgi:hypothetical protein
VECLGKNGKVLAPVLIHHCGPECDEDALADAVTLEEFTCVGSSGSSRRAVSRSMIEQYRCASRQENDTGGSVNSGSFFREQSASGPASDLD